MWHNFEICIDIFRFVVRGVGQVCVALQILFEQVLAGELLAVVEVVHLLPDEQVRHVYAGLAPRPENVPRHAQTEPCEVEEK